MDSLPKEIVTHIAGFVSVTQKASRKDSNSEPRWLRPNKTRGRLLALRACNRLFQQAIDRAARTHGALTEFGFYEGRNAGEGPSDPRQSPRSIETLARIFGAGCRDLSFVGASTAALSAVQSFVVSTQGRLHTLFIRDTSITEEQLVAVCRACPLLTWLAAGGNSPNLDDANPDALAPQIGAACPLLQEVGLPGAESFSEVEVYAMYFPNLLYLEFGAADIPPTHFERIARSARACQRAASHLCLNCYVDENVVENLAAIPELVERATHIDSSYACYNSMDTAILVARRFSALRDFELPSREGQELTTEFLERLCDARPELTGLNLGREIDYDDDCLGVVCQRLRLEKLRLAWSESLSFVGVDRILHSPCAATLRSIDSHMAFYSADLLRLVRGCPNITEVKWEVPSYGTTVAGMSHFHAENIRSVLEILESRGGKFDSRYKGVLHWFRPWEFRGVLARSWDYRRDTAMY